MMDPYRDSSVPIEQFVLVNHLIVDEIKYDKARPIDTCRHNKKVLGDVE